MDPYKFASAMVTSVDTRKTRNQGSLQQSVSRCLSTTL